MPRTWTVRFASCTMVCLAAMVLAGQPAEAGIGDIWAVDDGEKIFQGDLTNPMKTGAGNSVWDGTTVRLFAAHNEVVAFQLILEGDGLGANAVNVTVSDLTYAGSTIPGSHPLPPPNEYVGVGVELFTEHYLNVAVSSYNDPVKGGFYTTAQANPLITGWIPDALIPFSATVGKGGAPFDIGPSLNQGVWVDIYVAKGLPGGIYTGTIDVTIGGTPEATIPIELKVLSITLPDDNHYKSMVFYSDYCIRPRHNLSWDTDLTDMVLDYHRMAHRHRLEMVGQGLWDDLMKMESTLSGLAFTPAEGYEGPGEGVGNSLFSIHQYGASFGNTENEYRTNSDTWVNWFDANAAAVEYFLYLTDEPGPNKFTWINERAGWIHNNAGPGGRLPVFVTTWPKVALIGSVDIWSMQAPWYDPSLIAAAKARGERAWLYAGNRPQAPMDVMDEYGVAMRLKPWIAYKSAISRWFTWESTHWEPNYNEVPNNVSKNVFVDPVTFYAGSDTSRGNGDGTLFYPGEDYVFPAEDRGYPGPMSSMRMKMYRRGIQDYEYMWLAEQAGQSGDVGRIIEGLLPEVMWEAPAVPTWSNSNADYEQARRYFFYLLGPPRAPVANFSGSPPSGPLPLAVEFDDLSIFVPTSWSWHFGDGGTSTAQEPTHVYSSQGSYTVSLTASNAQGQDTEVKLNYVTVGPPVMEIYAYPDSWGTIAEWAGVTSSSGDLNALMHGVTSSSGDLNALMHDDQVYMVADSDATNQQYSMWYTSTTGYAPAQISKIQIQYQARASRNDTPDVLVWVQRSNGNFDERLTTRAWSTTDEWYVWETTDVSDYIDGTGTLGFQICACPQNGNPYSIWSDVMRFRLTMPSTVVVAPTADFFASPTDGDAPLLVSFTDLSMNTPSSWLWSFGDGGSATRRNPNHEYLSAGSYTVSLTVANSAGQDTETKTGFITVSDPLAPGVAFFAWPTMGAIPLQVQFTDQSTRNPTSWLWKFGDEETSAEQYPGHTYNRVGRYAVTLTVSNAEGSSSKTTECITVGFGDALADHWAFDHIVACVAAGIVFGYDDGLYRPALKVTRAAMAVYIARALAGGEENVPAGPEEPTFPDVPSDHWAYSSVEYAAANNVVEGYGGGTYQPAWQVTRAQMAVYIARSIVIPTGEAGLEPYEAPEIPTFTDVPAGYWSYLHVEYLVEQAIVAGYPDYFGPDLNAYLPLTVVTRDQMAVYVARAFGLPM